MLRQVFTSLFLPLFASLELRAAIISETHLHRGGQFPRQIYAYDLISMRANTIDARDAFCLVSRGMTRLTFRVSFVHLTLSVYAIFNSSHHAKATQTFREFVLQLFCRSLAYTLTHIHSPLQMTHRLLQSGSANTSVVYAHTYIVSS